jgi:hypothetical protein
VYAVGLARDAGLPDEIGIRIAILAEGAQVHGVVTDGPTIAGEARAAAQTLLDAA